MSISAPDTIPGTTNSPGAPDLTPGRTSDVTSALASDLTSDPTSDLVGHSAAAASASPASPRCRVASATVQTPDGSFSIVAAEDAVLASGWTVDVASLVALIHPSLRPRVEDVRIIGDVRTIGGTGVAVHTVGTGGTTNTGDPSNADHPHGTSTAGDAPRADDAVAVLTAAAAAVTAYYDGDLEAPGRVPVRQHSGEFRMHAWDVLREVEPGGPITYAEYAARSGRPAAVRAAAGACALNAAALFVPCHRVLRTNGSLGGFRYGLAIKERLLSRETAPAR